MLEDQKTASAAMRGLGRCPPFTSPTLAHPSTPAPPSHSGCRFVFRLRPMAAEHRDEWPSSAEVRAKCFSIIRRLFVTVLSYLSPSPSVRALASISPLTVLSLTLPLSEERLRVCIRIPKETSNTLVATVLGGLQVGCEKTFQSARVSHTSTNICLHAFTYRPAHAYTCAHSSLSSCPRASSQGARSILLRQSYAGKHWSP